jgi:hypothetical protein
MAGTGKTTIAYSLSEMLEDVCQLGASFFCSRLVPHCRDVNKIIPTIAYQLAAFSYPFRSALCDVLKDDQDVGSYNLRTQFNNLLNKPLLEIKEAMPTNVVVVIDALDECSDVNGTSLVLELLFCHARNLPIKFFVTSRPEPGISNKMMDRDDRARSFLILHDIAPSIVQEDIWTYLTTELAAMSPPPFPHQIRKLAEQSDNLFIYAATAVRYICPGNISVNSHQRLNTMLAIDSSKQSNKHKEIDILYAGILESALEDQGWELWEAENMKMVLHTVICMGGTATSVALTSLLRLDNESEVQLALEHLRSVIHVSEDTGLISALHASFPDYMLNQQRSGRFFCHEEKHNHFLTARCFDLMKNSLRFNICNLESSYVLDEDVPSFTERVGAAITPQLFYACRYWGNHILGANPSNELCQMLHEFLAFRLLFWIEVLSLGKYIDADRTTLFQAELWLNVSSFRSRHLLNQV